MSKLLTIVDGAIAIIIDLYTMVIANTVVYYPKHCKYVGQIMKVQTKKQNISLIQTIITSNTNALEK